MRKLKSSTSLLAGILALGISAYGLSAATAKDNDLKTGKTFQEKTDKEVKADTADKKPDEDAKDKKSDKKKKDKTLAEFVKDMEKIEGLFTFYRDKKEGDLFMEIREDQLDDEFIYFTYVRNGVTGVPGLGFRGATGNNQVFSLNKYYNRIEFIEENNSFYYDPDSPLSRSADANISSALLVTADIKATSEDKKSFIIPVGRIFLGESLTKLTRDRGGSGESSGRRSGPGKLNSKKSKIAEINNYPENSDVIVDYVFDGARSGPDMSNVGGIPRNVTMTLQHSFIKMPEDGFKARMDDPRVGFFMTRITDMTSHSATPYRDMIERWSLVKKDPTAKLSEPVKPITWWIENTTPLEYRDTIRDAVLSWKIAFEKAGFKNALQVEIQPDDADWDAGDIRYNVLRWTASPRPSFGGYGPHFVNPRTGEIIGADIMLEHSFVTNRMVYSGLFETAGLGLINAAEEPGDEAENIDLYGDQLTCSMGYQLQLSSLFGRVVLGAVLGAKSAPDFDKNQLLIQSLYYLALHEVGHTLGLNHNMKSSQLHDFKDIHNKELTGAVGLIGSVMDYPAINIARKSQEQGDFFTTRPGPYDLWAIEFGYSPDMDDPATRKALLDRSGEPGLAFGNDADDMRSTGKAMDPRVMIGDMSGDAIAFAENEMALAAETMSTLLEKYDTSGQSWHELRDSFFILSGTKSRAAGVVSRYVGGVYVDRAFVGQKTEAEAPFVPVSRTDQKRAMALLSREIFSPDAFGYSADLISHLQQQRRGYDFYSEPEDPKIHARVLRVQRSILRHITHRTVLKRMTDSGLYGNDYSVAEMIGDLTEAIFRADLKGDVNSYRQNLQVMYTQRLISIVRDQSMSNQAHAAAFADLDRIGGWMKKSRKGDAGTRAHRNFLKYTIDKALFPGQG